MVWIASIMLGWHYSVDGYVAVIGVAVCWWATGWLTTPIPALPVPVAERIASWREAAHELAAVETFSPKAGGRQSWTMWP